MTDKPTTVIPCQKKGAKFVAFLVDLDKERALVLDNYVWAVATKAVPLAVWKKEWQKLQLPEDKVKKILDGLAAYAIYAGMTPEAAEYLPNMVPMSGPARAVALDKGEMTLERFKSQAEVEKALDEAKASGERSLTGAALYSKAKKILAEAEEARSEAEVPPEAEIGLAQNATENDPSVAKPRTRTARRTETKKADKIRKLADEVTQDLTEVEEKGGNPAETIRGKETVNGFDVAKLKDPSGKYKSVSAMLKGLILENSSKKKPLTDDEIFEAVKAEFGIDESKKGYVQWNRNWLKKQGAL